LAYLQERIDRDGVVELLKAHLPYVDRVVSGLCGRWTRASMGTRVEPGNGSSAGSGSTPGAGRPGHVVEGVASGGLDGAAPHGKGLHQVLPGERRAMIAIVGGDGAGKSTVVDGLRTWLGSICDHDGTYGQAGLVLDDDCDQAVLKIGNLIGLYPVDSSFRETLGQKSLVSPGYPWLLREMCKARDRHFTYLRARRFAANGGLVILDRFPLAQIKLMDGPQVERFVAELGARPEAKQFLSPRRTSALVRFLKSVRTRTTSRR
jgi:hypothetical protein